MNPNEPVMPGQPLGRYQIDREVGRGGMGVVYKAYEPALKRTVAIKILLQPLEEDRKRFLREAEIAAKLQHPNIAPVYEVGEDEGRPFLSMAFIDGVSIAHSDAPLQRRIETMRDVARAVHYAHTQGIVHRDIKPDNIMIDRTGRAFIMDFGLARPVRPGSSLTMKGVLMGTPAYMSPEQARGGPRALTPESDVYSLGATLYEVLTGVPPLLAEDVAVLLAMVIREDPMPPRQRKPGIPADLETICLKAMSKIPAHRYPTAGALADDLDRWLKGEPILARRSGPVGQLTSAIRRRPFAATLALAILLGTSIGGAFLWGAIRRERQTERGIEQTAKRMKDARPHFDRGLTLRGREAVEAFSAAISICPDYGDAYHMRARARLAAGDPTEAVDADFARACELNPTSPIVFHDRATFILRERIVARLTLPVVPYDPGEPPPVSFAGVGPPALQQELKAITQRCLDRAAQLTGADDDLALGELLLAGAQWSLAEARLQRAPRTAESIECLGLARAGQGRTAEALADFTAALGLDADRASVRRHRVAVATAVGDRATAIADLGRLLDGGPRADRRELLVLRGWLRIAQGSADAEADFAEALASQTDDSVARLGRCIVRWWRGEHQAVRAELYAIKGVPLVVPRFARLATGDETQMRLFVESRPPESWRLTEAKAWLARDPALFLKIESPDAITLWGLAEAYAAKKDWVARYNALKKATELWPADCHAPLEIGRYCADREMWPQAKEALTKALSLAKDPDLKAQIEAELKKIP